MTTTIFNETSTCVYVNRKNEEENKSNSKREKKETNGKLTYSDAEYNDR